MEVGLKERRSNYYLHVCKLWKVSPCKVEWGHGLYASCHQSWYLEENVLSPLEEYQHVLKLTKEISFPSHGNGCCCLTQFEDPNFNGDTVSVLLELHGLGRALVLSSPDTWKWRFDEGILAVSLTIKLDCFNSFNQSFNQVIVWPHSGCNCVYGFMCDTLKILQQNQQFQMYLFIEE